MISFILQLCNFVATIHESHINHSYYETRTWSSLSVFSALSSQADWTWLGSLGLIAPDCSWLKSKSKSHCDWRPVSQQVLMSSPHLELMTRHFLLFDIYGLVFVGRPLWREDGSVSCICSWPLPAQSLSGPNPLELETIFYRLRLETFLFVAFHDSQGHGGGIRLRLHTGVSRRMGE
jgi:hypothetical protein